jgi:hypothetical protein
MARTSTVMNLMFSSNKVGVFLFLEDGYRSSFRNVVSYQAIGKVKKPGNFEIILVRPYALKGKILTTNFRDFYK